MAIRSLASIIGNAIDPLNITRAKDTPQQSAAKARQYGLMNDPVAQKQQQLRNAGYNIDVDGIWGPQSQAAQVAYDNAAAAEQRRANQGYGPNVQQMQAMNVAKAQAIEEEARRLAPYVPTDHDEAPFLKQQNQDVQLGIARSIAEGERPRSAGILGDLLIGATTGIRQSVPTMVHGAATIGNKLGIPGSTELAEHASKAVDVVNAMQPDTETAMIGNIAGQILPTLALGGAAGVGAKALGNIGTVARAAQAGSNLLTQLATKGKAASTIVNGLKEIISGLPMEAAAQLSDAFAEGQQVYSQARADGRTEEEALDLARNAYGRNAIVAAGLGLAQAGTIGRMAKAIQSGKAVKGAFAKNLGLNALFEGGQEAIQQEYVEKGALGKDYTLNPLNWDKDTWQAAKLGAIGGALFGAPAALGTHLQNSDVRRSIAQRENERITGDVVNDLRQPQYQSSFGGVINPAGLVEFASMLAPTLDNKRAAEINAAIRNKDINALADVVREDYGAYLEGEGILAPKQQTAVEPAKPKSLLAGLLPYTGREGETILPGGGTMLTPEEAANRRYAPLFEQALNQQREQQQTKQQFVQALRNVEEKRNQESAAVSAFNDRAAAVEQRRAMDLSPEGRFVTQALNENGMNVNQLENTLHAVREGIIEQTINNMESQLGGVTTIPNHAKGEGYIRVSENPGWYRQLYASLRRTPTRYDLRNVAEAQLRNGYVTGNFAADPRFAEVEGALRYVRNNKNELGNLIKPTEAQQLRGVYSTPAGRSSVYDEVQMRYQTAPNEVRNPKPQKQVSKEAVAMLALAEQHGLELKPETIRRVIGGKPNATANMKARLAKIGITEAVINNFAAGARQSRQETAQQRQANMAVVESRQIPSEKDNIANGGEAIRTVLANKTDVSKAMYRPETGWIEFVYGNEGTAAKNYEDGFGLAKIAKKHPDAIKWIPGVIANGKAEHIIVDNNPKTERYIFKDADRQAVVRLTYDDIGKSWLLTAFKKTKNPQTQPAVNSHTGATHKQTSFDSRDVGAEDLTTTTIHSENKPVKAEKIEDFGEKIGGARKDLSRKLAEATTLDIGKEPLSKAFPLPSYEEMKDAGYSDKQIALYRALRDVIPAKPRAHYKMAHWSDNAAKIRIVANAVLDSKLYKTFAGKIPQEVLGRAELYEALGHNHSFQGYSLKHGELNQRTENGEYAKKEKWFVTSPNGLIAVEDTREQTIDAFAHHIALLSSPKATPVAKPVSFGIYIKRDGTGAYIAKKYGSSLVKLKEFETVDEAKKYLKNNQAELEELLAKKREIPNERNAENRSRIGEDVRNGKDITPEMFNKDFGFRGVEFGNWVNSKERQSNLNRAFDALHDLAALLNIPTKAISLNGELGLAFGARGKGGMLSGGGSAAAHYEPGFVAINLTKKHGAGSLAHEWYHAFDNHLAKRIENPDGYYTFNSRGRAADNVRAEVFEAFSKLREALRTKTELIQRSKELDSTRNGKYFSKPEEVAARAFDSYIVYKLEQKGLSNDYLSNVKKLTAWAQETEKGYPFLTDSEVKAVAPAFDALFKTLKTEQTDKGVKLYSDPLFLQTLYDNVLTPLAKKGYTTFKNEALPHIVEFGKGVATKMRESGKLFTGRNWLAEMRENLGKLWGLSKSLVRQAWAEVKRFAEMNKAEAAGFDKYKKFNEMSENERNPFVQNLIDNIEPRSTPPIPKEFFKSADARMRLAKEKFEELLKRGAIVSKDGFVFKFQPKYGESKEQYFKHLICGENSDVVKPERIRGLLLADETIKNPHFITKQPLDLNHGNKMCGALYNDRFGFLNQLVIQADGDNVITSFSTTGTKNDKKATARNIRKQLLRADSVLYLDAGLSKYLRPATNHKASTSDTQLRLAGTQNIHPTEKLVNHITELVNNNVKPEEIQPHVDAMATSVIKELGISSPKASEWQRYMYAMRDKLKPVWDKVRPMVVKAWRGFEALMKDNSGSVRFDKFGVYDAAIDARAAMDLFAGKMADKAELLKALVYPKSLADKAAGTTMTILRHNLANMTRNCDALFKIYKPLRDHVDKLSEKQRYDFVNKIETGDIASIEDAKLRNLATITRAALDGYARKLQELGKLENPIENYFPHLWKEKGEAASFSKEYFRSLEGGKSFLKKRTIPTIKEGIEGWTDSEGNHHSLTPAYSNPVDMLLMKMYEIEKYLMGNNVRQEMLDSGLLKFIAADKTAPSGYELVNDKAFKAFGVDSVRIKELKNLLEPAAYKDALAHLKRLNPDITANTIVGQSELRNIGNLYMPEYAAKILKHYLGKGLRNDQTIVGSIFRTVQRVNNALNAIQLGLSLFHPAFVAWDTAISHLGLGARQVRNGIASKNAKMAGAGMSNVLKGISPVLITAGLGTALPISPFVILPFVAYAQAGMTVKKGSDFAKVYFKQVGGNENDARILNAFIRAGGRMTSNKEYVMALGDRACSVWKQALAELKDGNAVKGLGKAALGTVKLPWAIAEAPMKMFFHTLIPYAKAGLFHEMMQHELKYRPDMTEAELTKRAVSIWDSIENRLGMLTYDNLFWDNKVKDCLMVATRSVGWNLGTIRELGGAVADVGQGKLSYKTDYLFSLIAMQTLMATTMAYLLDDKDDNPLYNLWNGEYKKYFKNITGIKTGYKTPTGEDERINLPTYWKDVYHYSQDTVHTLMNKTSPVLNVASEIWRNKDFYGYKLTDEKFGTPQWFSDAASYIAEQMQPFGVRGAKRLFNDADKELSEFTAQDYTKLIMPFFGITPAPGNLNKSEAQKLMNDMLAARDTVEGRDKSSKEADELKRSLKRAVRAGNPNAVTDAVTAGKIDRETAQTILKGGNLTPLQAQFKALTKDAREKVWAVATDEEKSELRGIYEKPALEDAKADEKRAAIRSIKGNVDKYLKWYDGNQGKRVGDLSAAEYTVAIAIKKGIIPSNIATINKDGLSIKNGNTAGDVIRMMRESKMSDVQLDVANQRPEKIMADLPSYTKQEQSQVLQIVRQKVKDSIDNYVDDYVGKLAKSKHVRLSAADKRSLAKRYYVKAANEWWATKGKDMAPYRQAVGQ